MLCIEVCVCMLEQDYFLVKNNSEKERGQLVLTYMCICAECVSSGMSKSLNLLVIRAHCSRVNVFECVWLFLPRVSYSCRLWPPVCHLLFELKKFWVLIFFEGIEIRYFKFTRVDFISGQLKFKCTDIWVNTTCDLI